MLIGICGSICAGKTTVAQYLVERHFFTRLYIRSESDAVAAVDNADTRSSIPAWTTFASAEALLDFVTTRWRDRWVTTDIATEPVLDVFSHRPFFLLISVDAPVVVRWRRAQRRAAAAAASTAASTSEPSKDKDIDLETFVTQSDDQLYGNGTASTLPLLPVMARAAMRFANGGLAEKSLSAKPLFAALDKCGALDAKSLEQLLRPSWDRYFMSLASLAAQRSNCMKRRVGCVLVRESRVVSTGYNGTPRGLRNCGEGGCGRCNGGVGAGVGLATCLCLHAEENALLEAGRERIPSSRNPTDATVLYCNTCPCLTCSIKIVQVGIGEVVYSQGYSMDAETAAVFREAGVRLRQYIPPTQGLIHLDQV